MKGFERYFTTHLSWLRENGFESIPLENLIEYPKGKETLIPERPVAITLDDGSIESYTIAYPLLRKFRFTGTVFAPTAQKYLRKSGKDWWKEVESEGVLKIEGHSHTHALTFVNDQIEDFYVGKKQDLEPYIKGLVRRHGAPIFGLGYELVSQRFIPKKELMDECVNYVKKQGRVAFLKRSDWKRKLFQVVLKYKGERGRYETMDEKVNRIKEELKISKRIIEEAIGNGKRVHFFGYPFGAYDSDLIQYLKNSGYVGGLTIHPGGNCKGDNPFLVKRMVISEENSFGGLAKIFENYG